MRDLWIRQPAPLRVVQVRVGGYSHAQSVEFVAQLREPIQGPLVQGGGESTDDVECCPPRAQAILRVTRAMTGPTTPEQRFDAMLQPVLEFTLSWMAVLLIGAMVLLVGVVALAIAGVL